MLLDSRFRTRKLQSTAPDRNRNSSLGPVSSVVSVSQPSDAQSDLRAPWDPPAYLKRKMFSKGNL